MRVDSACLISGLPHGTRLGSLLVHQSVQFVLAETAPVTSRTAFVLRIPSDIHTTNVHYHQNAVVHSADTRRTK